MQAGPSRSRTRTLWTLLALVLVGLGALLLRGHEPGPRTAPGEAPQQPTAGDDESPCLRSVMRSVLAAGAYAAHQGQVQAYAFAPDGVSMATGGRDHVLRLWDRNGLPLFAWRGHRGPILDVDLARLGPGPPHVLTASADGTARLWAPNGEALVLRGHRGGVRRARISPEGARVLTLGLDGDARLWGTGGEGGVVLPDAGRATLEAGFLDGGHAWTRDDANTVRVFDLGEDPVRLELTVLQVAGVRSDARSGRALLLGAEGRVVPVAAGRMPDFTPQDAHAAQVLDATFLPDGSGFASASLDGTARVWSLEGRCLHVLGGHGLAVVRVRPGAVPGTLLTLAADGRVRLWSREGGLLRVLDGPALREVGVAGGPGPVIWGIPLQGAGLHVWSAEGGGHCIIPLEGGGRVLDVQAADNGQRLAVRDKDLGLAAIRLDGHAADVVIGPALATFGEVAVVSDAPPVPASGPARGDYLGTAGCASCHRQAYDLWAESNHARTFEPADAHNLPASVLEEAVAEHPPGRTTFRKTEEGYVATTAGPDGAAHDYVLGWVAGRRRIRMYVAPMEDGRLQVLPGMRAELPDEWFDYTHLLFGGGDAAAAPVVRPGDDAFWTGAARSWGARCAQCHSSGAEARGPEGGRGPRATWRDLGVDCEACHGPGRAHAEAWARGATNAPLLKLGTLERQASIDACTVCHMEGELVTAGYRHGDDLYEHLDPTLLLDPERVDPRGRPLELIYHGLSFAISRCAREGGLTCVRCHASHGGEHPALLGRPPTNHELCSECHLELVRDVDGHAHHRGDGSGASCVGCHMPRLVIERGHGIITDHSIGVPDPEARGDRVAQDACRWCHQFGLGSPPDVPILDDARLQHAYRTWWPKARRARPWMEALAAARLGEEGADGGLVGVLEARSLPREVRASAARLLAPHAPQRMLELLAAVRDADSLVRRSALKALAGVRDPAVDAALRTALTDASAPVRFAAARSALQGWWRVQADADLLRAILPVLREDAEARPNDEMRWFRLAAACDVAGDAAGAIEAYGRMVALHPFAQHARQRLEALRARR